VDEQDDWSLTLNLVVDGSAVRSQKERQTIDLCEPLSGRRGPMKEGDIDHRQR
jgi:hypothetical protein